MNGHDVAILRWLARIGLCGPCERRRILIFQTGGRVGAECAAACVVASLPATPARGLRGRVPSRNTRARRVGAAAAAAGGVAAAPAADAAVSSGRLCARRAPAHGSEWRLRPRRPRPRRCRRRRRRRRGAPAIFLLNPAARPFVPSTASSPPLPICGPTYPPLPIHRVAAAHVRIAQLGLESGLRQATTAQPASAGSCSDGGGRASVAAAAHPGGGGRC